MSVRALVALPLRLVAVGLALFAAADARADEPLSPEAIFGPPRPYAIESLRARFTHYDQRGHGYQSQADGSPGSEQLTVEQGQLEVTARQGDRITHTLWLPLDIITAASPDAVDKVAGVDLISSASRQNEAGSVELATSYRADRVTTWTVHGGFHFEEEYRSWDAGVAFARSLADDNALVAASVNQYVDWFDHFDIHGERHGRLGRSTTNANLGLTQLLSATTVAHVDYGVTLQTGTLGNTWNAVPASTGGFTDERLPTFRQRHAFVARLGQWLPWRAALHVYYRFYVDDWGILAHTAEEQLVQRLTPWLWVRISYRLHQQRGASFFTTRAAPDDPRLRTADSDLAPLWAQTVGGAMGADLGWRRLPGLHVDIGYDHYWRTNGLVADMVTCGLGFRF